MSNKSTMLAGREMDALVAEKVMGFEIMRAVGKSRDGCATYRHLRRSDGKDWYETTVPEYSTDIAAAWQVVEKWREHKSFGYGEIELRSEGEADSGLWTCHFGVISTAVAETAPLAICRAALQAVRGEESEER